MKRQFGYTLPELLIVVWVVVCLVGAGGWIWNIVKIAGSSFHDVTTVLVLRFIGVVLVPLGAVMGFV